MRQRKIKMKKILVIDDEIDICNMLKEYLQMEDYLVYTATDASEALKQICQQPDLILLDINMPEMDGYELCERIRDELTCPILFLSARTEEKDRVNGFYINLKIVQKLFHLEIHQFQYDLFWDG